MLILYNSTLSKDCKCGKIKDCKTGQYCIKMNERPEGNNKICSAVEYEGYDTDGNRRVPSDSNGLPSIRTDPNTGIATYDCGNPLQSCGFNFQDTSEGCMLYEDCTDADCPDGTTGTPSGKKCANDKSQCQCGGGTPVIPYENNSCTGEGTCELNLDGVLISSINSYQDESGNFMPCPEGTYTTGAGRIGVDKCIRGQQSVNNLKYVDIY